MGPPLRLPTAFESSHPNVGLGWMNQLEPSSHNAFADDRPSSSTRRREMFNDTFLRQGQNSLQANSMRRNSARSQKNSVAAAQLVSSVVAAVSQQQKAHAMDGYGMSMRVAVPYSSKFVQQMNGGLAGAKRRRVGDSAGVVGAVVASMTEGGKGGGTLSLADIRLPRDILVIDPVNPAMSYVMTNNRTNKITRIRQGYGI